MSARNAATLPFDQYTQYFEGVLRQKLQPSKSKVAPQPLFNPNEILNFLSRYFPNQTIEQTDAFLLTLTLIPHIDPVLLDRLFAELLGEGNFPQLGGVRGKQHRGILPTGEMALFLLTNNDSELKMEIQKKYLSPAHWLFRDQVLYLAPPLEGEPRLSGKLSMHEEYVELLTTGEVSPPRFSTDFPAQHIETKQDWDDLVLHSYTLQQVKSLQYWLDYGNALLEDWGMDRKFKPGYRALFYGPSGTGKTLTASLLGKYSGRDVYRVDLSMVVSKYIGETEKNLSKLFDKAEHKDWILFFDEADALFGKRTGVRDAHDRYANQEISYLLQRVESYNGLVILASNFKDNIDNAFLRRFQAIIHFPMPRPGERLLLWQKAIPEPVSLDELIDLRAIADRFELTGADIMNVVHYCCLQVMAKGQNSIDEKLLIAGIQREMKKVGRPV